MSKKQSDLLVIGHRGASGLAPENTIASLQAALDNNVDMVEIDVHVTRDGSVVLNHDPHFVGTDGKKVRIHDITHADVKSHREEVTTLQEAIEFLDRRVPLIIEIKPKVDPDQVIHLVTPYFEKGWTLEDIRFCSYSARILKRIRLHIPECTVILNEDWSSIRASYQARKLGTAHIALYYRWLWKPVIRGLRRRGFILYSFSINNPGLARRWNKAGLAGVYTDRPDKYV